MVSVADEVQAADPVDLDRGDDRPCPPGPVQVDPALPVDRRAGAEPTVEVAHSVHAADDGVDFHAVESELALAGRSERADDLVEGEQLGLVVGAQVQPAREP